MAWITKCIARPLILLTWLFFCQVWFVAVHSPCDFAMQMSKAFTTCWRGLDHRCALQVLIECFFAAAVQTVANGRFSRPVSENLRGCKRESFFCSVLPVSFADLIFPLRPPALGTSCVHYEFHYKCVESSRSRFWRKSQANFLCLKESRTKCTFSRTSFTKAWNPSQFCKFLHNKLSFTVSFWNCILCNLHEGFALSFWKRCFSSRGLHFWRVAFLSKCYCKRYAWVWGYWSVFIDARTTFRELQLLFRDEVGFHQQIPFPFFKWLSFPLSFSNIKILALFGDFQDSSLQVTSLPKSLLSTLLNSRLAFQASLQIVVRALPSQFAQISCILHLAVDACFT